MLTDATGPSQGISDIAIAAEAPIVPNTSGSFSPSYDRTLIETIVSLIKPFGNNGLRGLSVNLAASISFSLVLLLS